MATEVRADPVEMAVLGKACTTIAGAARDALSTGRQEFTVGQDALGNTEGVEDFATAYGDLLEDAGLAVEDLAEVLEGDTDRVYRIAFSYQEQDKAAAEALERAKNPPPTPKPEPGPPPVPPKP